MGKVLETQKIAMSHETGITKQNFRVSLLTEWIKQVVNTDLNKKL